MSSPPRATDISPESPRHRGVEELCEEFVAVCESAVHPLEIAGALEFDGWTDHALRNSFGASDVFTLAEVMYRRVPRRPAEPPPQPDLWRTTRWRPALHSLLYGSPAVCFTAAAGLLAGPGASTVVIVSLLVSWALSQGLAYLGYLRLGSGVPGQAERVLLTALSAGLTAVLAAISVVSVVASAGMPVLIFGVAMGSYMLGATVLLVLGAERQVLLALSPGVLGATAFLLLGRPSHLEHATWATLSATPLLAVGLALARTIRAVGPVRWAKLLSVTDVRKALPSAGFGLVAGGLLLFPVAVATPAHGAGSASALLALLPLTLSMGAAEWLLVWFRRRTQRAMRSTHNLRVFASRARLLLAAAVLQYLIMTMLLTAAVLAVVTGSRMLHPHWTTLQQIATYLTIGCSLFVSLLLNAFDSRIVPVIAGTAALAVEIACHIRRLDNQICVGMVLLAALAAYAAAVLGSAARHAS